jgi:glyoxylase-like metal-dependent hydrolase (beta-lactamase superfamily II)
MFHTADRDATPYTLTGDVLFAGSIGRTDLPGGSEAKSANLAGRPGAHALPLPPTAFGVS